MNKYTRISVIAAPRTALNKLSRAHVPVYDCAQSGALFIFGVRDKYVKKVFAIFAHPCYNVTIKHKSALSRFKYFAKTRAFLFVGAALFAACALLSDCFILKIEVTGSGAYLKQAVLGIVRDTGLEEGSFYRGADEVSIISQVLALPNVTFCSVQKSGSVLYIDVECEEESAQRANYSSLVADRAGVVQAVVAICGTAAVSAGDTVAAGDVLIAAYTEVNSQEVSCLAVGYARLECTAQINCFAEEDSEQNLNAALSSALLYAGDGEILSQTYTVKTVAEGVIYSIDFTYLHTVSINFD